MKVIEKLIHTINSLKWKFILICFFLFSGLFITIIKIEEIILFTDKMNFEIYGARVSNIIIYFKDNFPIYILKNIVIILFVISAICLILKVKSYVLKNNKRLKKKVNIFSLASLNNFEKKFSNKTKEKYEIVSIHELRQYELKKMNEIKTEIIKESILELDEEIENLNFNNDVKTLGFIGIAHTPMVLRAGYRFGDEKRILLLHKSRNDEFFDVLNYDKTFPKLICKENIRNNKSNILIVDISTSFQISEKNIDDFCDDNINRLSFKTSDKDFDNIKSMHQVDNYVKKISSRIREVSKINNIKKVHLLLSTSVSMTFALGQALSEKYDPEIIAYDYNIRLNKFNYPWGISIFKSGNDCVVIKR